MKGRYRVEIYFKEWFAHEYILSPRRLLLLETGSSCAALSHLTFSSPQDWPNHNPPLSSHCLIGAISCTCQSCSPEEGRRVREAGSSLSLPPSLPPCPPHSLTPSSVAPREQSPHSLLPRPSRDVNTMYARLSRRAFVCHCAALSASSDA